MAGASRLSVGTAAPCFTTYNVKSRIAAFSTHLKNLHGFCSQGFSQLLRLFDSRQCTYMPREACAWGSRALNSLWSMASPYCNIQLTFEQEEFRRNERYH